jgi:hypothetical protein
MPRPSAYLDECVDHGLVSELRQRGFSVTTAQAEGIVGVDDEAQLAYTAARNLVLLSHNWHHFQKWHFRFTSQGRSHGGIIILPGPRPLAQLAARAALMLDWLATMSDYRSQLFRWGELQARLTQGYRLPGYSDADVALALGRPVGRSET